MATLKYEQFAQDKLKLERTINIGNDYVFLALR